MRRTVIALGMALVALGLTAPPAVAEQYGQDDPADATGSLTDIHAYGVNHRDDDVVVQVVFADLRRDSVAGLSVYFDTDKRSSGPEYVLGSGLGAGTDYTLTPTDGWKPVEQPLSCEHVVRLKWRTDLYRARLDRECLGSPDRLRISVKMRDDFDASHPITDWAPDRRRFSQWVAQG